MFLAEVGSSGCLHQKRGLVAPCAQDLLDLHAHTFLAFCRRQALPHAGKKEAGIFRKLLWQKRVLQRCWLLELCSESHGHLPVAFREEIGCAFLGTF